MILSACETAEAATIQDGPALAHALVSAGIPAVIGMRRLVDLTDTNRFCAELYPELLAIVSDALQPIGPPNQPQGVRIIDWASALTAPRRAMSGADPCAVDSWTDPVLYVQDDALRVFPPSQQLSPSGYATLRAKLDQFQGYLETLDPATTAPGIIDEVRDRIAELEAALRQAGMNELPAVIAIDAWTGIETAHGDLDPTAARWGARGGLPRSQQCCRSASPPIRLDGTTPRSATAYSCLTHGSPGS